MANLKHTDTPYIQKFVESIRGSGYVLDFSDANFSPFILSISNIDIDEDKYFKYGGSKGKRFRAFIEMENDLIIGKTLQALIQHWEAYQILHDGESTKQLEMCVSKVRKISNRLLGKKEAVSTEISEEEFLDKDFEEIPIEKIGLSDSLVKIIKERIQEIQSGIRYKTSLSVIFLCGSSLEGILLGVASNNPTLFNQAKASPKDKMGKVFPLYKWSLSNFIDVANEIGFVGLDVKKFSHALRDFRNYIHPYEQWNSGFSPDHYTAKISWQVLKAAIDDLSKKL